MPATDIARFCILLNRGMHTLALATQWASATGSSCQHVPAQTQKDYLCPRTTLKGLFVSLTHILACSPWWAKLCAAACLCLPCSLCGFSAHSSGKSSVCTQNVCKVHSKHLQSLNQRDLNLKSMGGLVPPRKQQLTSLLFSNQVTLQPKGDLSMALVLLQDCQCQRTETNHCELCSLLK